MSEPNEQGSGMEGGWGALEFLHRGADAGVGVAEHAHMEDIPGLNLILGPAGLALGQHTLSEGIENGDAREVMEGGAGMVGGGASTVSGMGWLLNLALGGGEAVEAGGAGVALPAAAETVGLGATEAGAAGAGAGFGLSWLGPLAAAFGLGAWGGGKMDGATNEMANSHNWWDGQTEEEHRLAEGRKVDSGGTVGAINGGVRAAEVALDDNALMVANSAMPIGGGQGVVDLYMNRKNAEAHAEQDQKTANAALNDMPVHEESSTRSSSTSREESTEEYVARRKAEIAAREEANEIQMPNQDMRTHK